MDANTKARNILQALHFDFTDFTLAGFLQAAGRSKGRHIEVFACDLPANVFGGWLTDEAAPMEYIFYQKGLPEIQQIHVQLHEVAHFLMGHPTRRINRQALIEAASDAVELLLSELAQLRSSRPSDLESEAETLSSMIQKQAIRYSKVGLLTRHSTSTGELADFLKEMGS